MLDTRIERDAADRLEAALRSAYLQWVKATASSARFDVSPLLERILEIEANSGEQIPFDAAIDAIANAFELSLVLAERVGLTPQDLASAHQAATHSLSSPARKLGAAILPPGSDLLEIKRLIEDAVKSAIEKDERITGLERGVESLENRLTSTGNDADFQLQSIRYALLALVGGGSVKTVRMIPVRLCAGGDYFMRLIEPVEELLATLDFENA